MHHVPRPSGLALTPAERDRVAGAIVGAAVGDALGAPFEFGPAGEYSKRFPQPVLHGTGEMVGGGSFGWAPGEFTDDTQMALSIAGAIIDAGGYDPDVVWTWCRAWATTAKDIGITTRAALAHADWRTVPRDRGRGSGNGALMRSSVLVAALLGDEDETARDIVVHQGSLTHSDPAAGWGAWIAVQMCRIAVRGGDPLPAVAPLVASLPDDVRPAFEPLLVDDWTPDLPHPPNGTVWGCLAEAVWAVRSTSSFEHAVIAAIDLGDDTDTVACVTGAIAGAIYGADALPSRWANAVHGTIDTPNGRRSFTSRELTTLVDALLGGATGASA